jgi:hypothetical protein
LAQRSSSSNNSDQADLCTLVRVYPFPLTIRGNTAIDPGVIPLSSSQGREIARLVNEYDRDYSNLLLILAIAIKSCICISPEGISSN